MFEAKNRLAMSVKALTKDEIGQDFIGGLSVQDYQKKPTIEGVQLIDLKLMLDDGGCFTELLRLDENGNFAQIPDFKVRQSNYSQMMPGVIKAFHLHFNQEDVWFIHPYDRLLIGLFDARKESKTYNNSMRFVMGGGRPQLLYIPRGVAHGLANVWNTPASMIYFVNQFFDVHEPDEHRLPWDILGEDFWQIKKG
ncbi:dTDP-4-dehydrorhamnose 3,5-epimerase family protein [Candidatus Obscuribacterales bacterium]|nr:dTDP-4-dehydrorhamnose 3,5-epimerase family protein [Candidatus Obscuribacterales bacterium]